MNRSLKAYALALLSRREYSRYELSVKMRRYAKRWALSETETDDVLAWLQEHRFQSDSRFASSLLRRRLAQFGDRAIAAEFALHGLQWPLPSKAQRFLQTGVSQTHAFLQPLDQEPLFEPLGLFADQDSDLDGSVPSEEERALAWLQRRYALRLQADSSSEERQQLEQKAKRALASRGFGFEAIRKAWRSFLEAQELC